MGVIPPKILRFVIIGLVGISIIVRFIGCIVYTWWLIFTIPWNAVILAIAIISYLTAESIVCGSAGNRLCIKKVFCLVGGVMAAMSAVWDFIDMLTWFWFVATSLIAMLLMIPVTAGFFIDALCLNDKT